MKIKGKREEPGRAGHVNLPSYPRKYVSFRNADQTYIRLSLGLLAIT